MQPLETPRLLLREWRESDLPTLVEVYDDPALIPYQDGVKPSPAFVRSKLETGDASWEANGYGTWVMEEKASGEVVGTVGLSFPGHWPSPEVSWAVHTRFRNRGYATEAATAALDFGFAVRGLPRLLAVTSPGNEASERVMQKLHMSRTTLDTCPLRKIPVVVYETTHDEWLALAPL